MVRHIQKAAKRVCTEKKIIDPASPLNRRVVILLCFTATYRSSVVMHPINELIYDGFEDAFKF